MDINLENWFKPKIDKKTIKKLSQRNNWRGLLHFFIYFLSLFVFGYLAYLTWGTLWTLLFFFIYGTIYSFSVSNWHETVHRTAFRSRWMNDFFYHISSFMGDFEGFRWRWSHTFHHTYTLQTKDDYDYENQISRPTDLIWFFINFLPFSDFLYPHKTLKFEILKHAFGFLTPVVEISAPQSQKTKIIWNSRLYVIIWAIIIIVSIMYQSFLPIIYILIPTYYGKTFWLAVNLTQHLGASLDVKDHRLSTYSIKLDPISSFLYWRMEYHLEHHMFPTIPSYNLHKLHEEIKMQLPKRFPGMFSFYKQVLPTIVKQAADPNCVFKINLPKN